MATKSTSKTTAPKKAAVEKAEKKVKEQEPTKVEVNENELLKKQIAEMQAQMKMMADMIAKTTNDSVPATVEDPKASNRMIRFVNLKDNTVVLKGSSYWDIEGRYSYRDFPEKEARVIALNMANYLRKGSVYINDAQFVKDNDLDYVYATLLSDKELKELLNTSAANVIETYKNVNDNQKDIIIDLITKDKLAGKKIDNNILVELSALSGKNLLNPEEDE